MLHKVPRLWCRQQLLPPDRQRPLPPTRASAVPRPRAQRPWPRRPARPPQHRPTLWRQPRHPSNRFLRTPCPHRQRPHRWHRLPQTRLRQPLQLQTLHLETLHRQRPCLRRVIPRLPPPHLLRPRLPRPRPRHHLCQELRRLLSSARTLSTESTRFECLLRVDPPRNSVRNRGGSSRRRHSASSYDEAGATGERDR